MSIDKVRELGRALRERIGRVIIGQEEATHLMMVALISEGHLLFEGPPGTGKTLLARTFAACIKLDFKRVQFTPDLMPGRPDRHQPVQLPDQHLQPHQGAAVHRVPARRRDQPHAAEDPGGAAGGDAGAHGHRRRHHAPALGSGFLVLATQNPIEQEGTYPLPEAQLDRFLFKVLIGYPGRDEEVTMVKTHGHQTAMPNLDRLGLTPLCDLRFITWVRQVVAGIRLADETVAYVVDLIRATRNHPALQYGASPRAANMLATAARAAAVLEGRDFVIPDDIKSLFKPLLRHRVVLSPSAEVDGLGPDPVLEQILGQVAAPR